MHQLTGVCLVCQRQAQGVFICVWAEVRVVLVRLEELSEARQSVVNRVKAAEKERDGLEGAKAVAEAYLSKERECTISQSTIFQIFVRDGQARHGTSMHNSERLLKQPRGSSACSCAPRVSKNNRMGTAMCWEQAPIAHCLKACAGTCRFFFAGLATG